MPRTWQLSDSPRSPRLPLVAAQVLLAQPASAPPAARVLALLNAVARVDFLSWVAYADDVGDGGAPKLLAGVARQASASAVTPRCFALYRQHFWRNDESTRIAGRLCAAPAVDGCVTALQMSPGELPSARWREEIYESARLVDRLSFFYRGGQRRTYAFNLYRDRAAGAFAPAELESLLALAPALHGLLPAEAQTLPERLKRAAPALSARELAVCVAVAAGTPADGIAVQLDVAPSTVHTLRKRAYAKLAEAGLPGGRLALLRLASANP
jgi:DNA-binding CsgD family transcriptional regulator